MDVKMGGKVRGGAAEKVGEARRIGKGWAGKKERGEGEGHPGTRKRDCLCSRSPGGTP